MCHSHDSCSARMFRLCSECLLWQDVAIGRVVNNAKARRVSHELATRRCGAWWSWLGTHSWVMVPARGLVASFESERSQPRAPSSIKFWIATALLPDSQTGVWANADVRL